VAIIGDTHIGGTTAISPPEFEIHTGRKDETQLAAAEGAVVALYFVFRFGF
jgi:hypothetical protein